MVSIQLVRRFVCAVSLATVGCSENEELSRQKRGNDKDSGSDGTLQCNDNSTVRQAFTIEVQL